MLHPRDSVAFYALRYQRERQRTYPLELARFPVVRLRTVAEVDNFLRDAAQRS